MLENQLIDKRHLSNETKQFIKMQNKIHSNCYLNLAESQLATVPELDQLRIQIIVQDLGLVLALFH